MKQIIATLSLAFVLAAGALAGTSPVPAKTKQITQTRAGQPAAKTMTSKKPRKHKAAKAVAPVKR